MNDRARWARLTLAMSIACSLTILTGCAAMQQKVVDAGGAIKNHGGTLLGAAAGAATGALLCDDDNRIKCAVAGGVVGASLGYLWDERRKRIRQIAEQRQIPVTTQSVQTFNAKKQNGLAVSVNDGNMFPVGSAELTTDAASKLRALASAYQNKPQSLLVIGHTDSSGPDAFNLMLSEKRARTVASLMAAEGIDRARIFYQGVGESQPIANNDTAGGRAANRRVEIVETDSDRSIAAYSLERESDPAYLAYSNKTSEEKSVAKRSVDTAAIDSTPTRTSKAVQPSRAPEPKTRKKPAQHVAQAETSTPAAEPAGTRPTESSPSPKRTVVDFGGNPAQKDISTLVVAAGPRTNAGASDFSLISSAQAAPEDDILPCYMNSPRNSGAVRNLSSGQALDPSALDQSDYWPGLNGNVWTAMINNNLVALKDLRVMADSGTVVGRPSALVYTNYNGDKQTPDFRNVAQSRSYKGDDGLIVRSYFTPDAPMQCMDIVMANRATASTKAGVLYYDSRRGLYQNTIEMHRLGAGR